MHARGLMLIGKFVGTEPIIGKDGTSYPGLYKVVVDVSPLGGEPVLTDASFNSADRDTGEPTRFQLALIENPPRPGDELAIKVRIATKQGSSFANKEAVAFCKTDELDLAG